MTDANERDATLAQRIRDALRGVTPGEWDARLTMVEDEAWEVWAITGPTTWGILPVCITDDPSVPHAEADARFIAAAPSLLRDALARIEADAARIAALEEQVAKLESALDRVAGGQTGWTA